MLVALGLETLEVVLGFVLIELEDVLEAATFDCVLEVVVLKNALEVVALEKVPTEVMKPVLLLVPVDFAKVEVVVVKRAEELALKIEELDGKL